MSENNDKPNQKAMTQVETYFRNIQVLNQVLSESGQAFQDSHASLSAPCSPADRAVRWLGCNLFERRIWHSSLSRYCGA